MFSLETRSSDVEDIDAIDTQEMNKIIKYRQQLRSHLRERFRIEYLGQLQQRTLHRALVKSLAVSNILLLESDIKKHTFWPLARVLELIPVKDGRNRRILACSKLSHSHFYW
ncbi:integrase catalytic domain-containing protein [Nephila pilipes]|uniref:Integrase catalytic domain-containing protein n=1 Tax=Nephila pilipes TaxID=299642 RepID=A0A8X6TY38_NEPPI|nr:integrase catalytic domain-containing protein [Nephila pilipes]